MDSKLTINAQRMGSEEMSVEFWDAIKGGKFILRYSRSATERGEQTKKKGGGGEPPQTHKKPQTL